MPKTYLITGVAGFIGSHIAEALVTKGIKVVGLDNFDDFYLPEIKRRNIGKLLANELFTLCEVDVRDKVGLNAIFEEYKPQMVIHLCAMAGVRPSIEQPELYVEVNVNGTVNILEAMKRFAVKKFIFASSSSVYGNNSKVPFVETDNVDKAISPYASTKKAGEVIAHTYHHLYGIDMLLLRFFTVYGERQRPDLAIHKFTRLITEGQPIPFYGDGLTFRDYTHISDIVSGVVEAVKLIESEENLYEIINIGNNQTVSLREMVAHIEKAVGKKAIINKMPMQMGDVQKTYADIGKAKRLLGYNPKMNFEEGIRQFVKWYEQINNL